MATDETDRDEADEEQAGQEAGSGADASDERADDGDAEDGDDDEETSDESDEDTDDGDSDESDEDADDDEDSDESDEDDQSDDGGDEDEDEDDQSDDGGDEDEEEAEEKEAEEEEAEGEEAEEEKRRPARGKGKKRKKGGKAGLSAGQRLAAAKAAKAARKAAKRGRQAEKVETEVLKKASAAAEWAQKNRRTLWAALIAVVLVVGGATVWSMYSGGEARAAADELWTATSTANAAIRSPDEPPPADDDEEESYASAAERAEKALGGFRKVLPDHRDAPSARWARLGEGTALLSLDRADEAREAFEAALRDAGDDPIVAWRALEGIAFSFEAEEAWSDAINKLQELKELDDGRFEDIAEYHIARMYLAQGETDRGKEMLRALVERLNGEDAPERPYVADQAELRLMELDSSLVPHRRQESPFGPGGGGIQMPGGQGGEQPQLTPEQLQQLLQKLQKQGAAQ